MGETDSDGEAGARVVTGYRFPLVFTTWNCGEWTVQTVKQQNAEVHNDDDDNKIPKWVR